MALGSVEQIDALTREEAELMAAKLFRALATQAIRDGAARRRNIATAAREAAQLTHLAIRLESFANGAA